MFRSKILLYLLVAYLSIFTIPFGYQQLNNCSITNITTVVYGNYAPPVQPIKPALTNKKELKKILKKDSHKRPIQPSEIGLLLINTLYGLVMIYWSIIGIGLMVLGVIALTANVSGLSIWAGILFIFLGLAWLALVLDLWPIFKKLGKLRDLPWGNSSANIPTKLFNNTLWLALGYLVLVFITAMFPFGFILINNIWLLILIIILASTLQGRTKRKLLRNLNHLLEYIDTPTTNKGKTNNINNNNFNQDLLDEDYR